MKKVLFSAAAALLMLVSAAAMLLLLELGMGALHVYLPRDLKIVWIRSQLMGKQGPHRFHRELLWAPAPALALQYPGTRFQWRIKHVPHPKDPSVGYRADGPSRSPVDLVVIGDSYTYGFEVDQDRTWVELLKRASGLSAVNLAVTSYGTSQEAIAYKLYGMSFKPRLVLQVIAGNDPLDNVFFNEINAGKDPDVRNFCWFLHVPQGSPACRASAWAMKHTIVGGMAVFNMQAYLKRRDSDNADMKRGTEMICADIKRIRSLTQPLGVKYAAVLTGSWLHPPRSPLRQRLDACLRDRGVPSLQLSEFSEARRRGRPLIGRFDWHWNDEGHRYVAESIHEFLRAQGWL